MSRSRMNQCLATTLAGAVTLALSPALAGAGGSTKAGDANQLMNQVEERDDGKDQTSTISLEIQPKKGTKRLRRFVLLRKEYPKLTKMVTFFLAPTDVRDSAFMVWDKRGAEDQRWLYLPAVGQVRRLAASDSRQSFFGSDFVYEDLTNRDPELDTHEMVGSQKVDDWDCVVVESKPKEGRGLDFVRYRSWVWKDDPIVLRQEYYDNSGNPVRRFQAHSLKKTDGVWTWVQGTMWNLKSGSRSRFELSDVGYNKGVQDERFAESQLSRGAPQK
jgi:outer membrane lipoprotein-sorting protein